VVMKPARMDAETLKNTMKDVWLELYDKKTVYRKFMRTLKDTNNVKASSWALTTNLVYRAMVGEVFGFETFSIEDILGKNFPSR